MEFNINKCCIAHNLRKSPYRFKVDTIIYVFSSRLYLNKFKNSYLQNRLQRNQKLEIKHNLVFDFKLYHDIILYDNIEKRGFLLLNNDNDFIDKEQIEVTGETITRS